MSQRLEEFLRELPARGVSEEAVQLYRTVLEELEAFLGKAAALRFSRYEVNRFVTQRQRAGATERELKNLNTACAAYLSYCEALAPAPAVGTAGEPDTSPSAVVAAPPPQERRKVKLIGLGAVALVVCLIGGCLADKARQSRVERAFSFELKSLGAATTGNRDLLREQVLAAARRHGVRTESLKAAIGVAPLAPDNVNRLPLDQRMQAMAALQAQTAAARPTDGLDGVRGRTRVVEAPLWFVEINVLGEVKGVFGAHQFDLAVHVLGGTAPPAPPP